MEELVGRPSHLSPPLIGYLAAPQLSIHLSAARFPTRRAVAVVGLLLHCTIPSCDDGTGTKRTKCTYCQPVRIQAAPQTLAAVRDDLIARSNKRWALSRAGIKLSNFSNSVTFKEGGGGGLLGMGTGGALKRVISQQVKYNLLRLYLDISAGLLQRWATADKL